MTATLETPASGVCPDQPPLPAEVATDVPPAAVLGEPAEILDSTTEVAEPAPSQTSEIDTLAAAEPGGYLCEEVRGQGGPTAGGRLIE